MRLITGRSIAAYLALTVVAVACSREKPTGSDTTSSTVLSPATTATAEDPPPARLEASGATLPRIFYDAVISRFEAEQPLVDITYSGGGSGKGRSDLRDGVVDWAGSDVVVRAEDRSQYQGELLYIPTIGAPIAVSYNLATVQDLRLDADTIAMIFKRRIKRWNDPAITALNPGVTLPSTEITVVHRSDSSGTTENFSKYLLVAAPTTWDLKSASTIEWPVDTEAREGNQGVAALVRSTQGAIGYVDLADAKLAGVQVARVRNRSGNMIGPTVEGAAAALEGVTVNADLTYNPLNAEGPHAYPITAPTWILVYRIQPDETKAASIRSFLRYLLTDGQGLARELNFAALPPALQQRSITSVEGIVART